MADLNLKAGTNITLEQEEDDLYINSTTVEPDLSNYYTKAETDTLLDNKADTSDIPTKTSDLTNDSDFTTKTYVDELVGDIESALEELDIGGGTNG